MNETVTNSVGALARGATVNTLGSGFNVVSRLVFNLLVARLLGPSDLGVYFLALTISNIAAALAVGGFDLTVVRYLARYRAQQDWGAFRGTLRFAMGAVAGVAVAAAAALLVGGHWLTSIAFGKPEVAGPLRVMALYVPFFAVETLLLAATQSFKQMKYKAYIESMLNPSLRIVALGAIFLAGGGIYAVIGSYVFTVALCALLAWHALGRCIPVDLADYAARADRPELLRYALPLFVSNVLTFLILHTDSLMLAHFGSTADVGVYSVCIRLVVITTFPLPVMSQIFAPIIAELHQRGSIDELGGYFKVVTLWAVEVFIPVLLVLLIAPQQVLSAFGPAFSVAAPCLLILAAGHFVNVLTGPVGLVLNMGGWTRLQMINAAAVLLLQSALSVALIPRMGIIGAALANATAITLVNLARVVQLYRRMGIHPFSWSLAKPLLAFGVALLAGAPFFQSMVAFSGMRLALLWAAMLFIYVSMLAAFGADHYSREAGRHIRSIFTRRLTPMLPRQLNFYVKRLSI